MSKTLNEILGTFTKTLKDLEDFGKRTAVDIKVKETEMKVLANDLQVMAKDSSRASTVKKRIAKLVL